MKTNKQNHYYFSQPLFVLIICSIIFGILPGCKKNSISTDDREVENKDIYKFVLPNVPASLTNPRERADYMVNHYWDNYDFADTGYLHLPEVVEQAFVNYINILPHANEDISMQSVKSTLTKAEVDDKVYAYFLDIFRKYLYTPNSEFRNDTYYYPVLEHSLVSEKTDETQKSKARFELEMISKNRVGDIAADFVYTMGSGKTSTLHKIKGNKILLLFYDPECRNCAQLMRDVRLSSILAVEVENKRLTLFAFYPGADEIAWNSYRGEIPSSWINGYDGKNVVEDKVLYDLKAIPSLYLLDKEKKVILKDASFETVERYLEENMPVMLK